ncbi:hypothetical protein [Myceligenerans crystallogenes]|uniref:Uncharacterized protein n=1 Tax=Myceligenerans crystallogenes TaxID=316335 RepID=A0ABN2N233_9MICO
MATNLACVGLDVRTRSGFRDLVQGALPEAKVIAEEGGVRLQVWTDASGARLVITTEGDLVRAVTTSYAGPLGARLADVRAADGGLAIAEIVDADGDILAGLACELEELQLLGDAEDVPPGDACIVGLGRSVEVFAGADEFLASDASLMTFAGDDDVDDGGEPMRFEPESFSPDGAFTMQADAVARVNGTVLDVAARRVERTGQEFTAAQVRTDGFEITLCVPAGEPRLAVGNVVAANTYLVASLPSLLPA